MDTPQEDIINVNGTEYIRTRVTASMRMVKESDLPEDVSRAKASSSTFHWQDGVNPDLVWTQFLLDTEGDNKNWDYMPRPSLMKHFASAKFKPFDMEHVVEEGESMVYMDKKAPPVRNTIFGVMTHSALANADGELLSDKAIAKLDKADDHTREKSERLAVVGWAALYNFLFPKTVAGVLTGAEDGIMKVSMERWIKTYDFLYRDEDGVMQAISKADAKSNGYHDKWEKRQMINGYPIWRRSLSFVYGGVASTTNPANTQSMFLEHSDSTVKAAASVTLTDSHRKLLERHSEIHREFAISTDDNRKQALIREHSWIHKCLSEISC